MKTITIKNKEIEIKDGDYILDNYSVMQFVAGDGRIIIGTGANRNSSVVLSKKDIKAIDFDSLRKETVKTAYSTHTRYYFN